MEKEVNNLIQQRILSWVQVRPLLALQDAAPITVEISFDLGLSLTTVLLTEKGLRLSENQYLSWNPIQEIGANENACYFLEDGAAFKIQSFSESFNRFYALMPTERAPTMLISGIPMHRIKDVDPYQDTMTKVRSIKPVTGKVLDTTMGLGYTAIEMAKHAEEVITIELDPAVLEICRFNPWSKQLFTNPRIKIQVGDSYDEVEKFADDTFSRILHDPPTFSLAGDLYATDFYRQLHRILKPKGRLFHYIGDPKSKSGRGVTRGVKRRLKEAGFQRVVDKAQAFGVVAYK